ncbi:MAG TPA: ABC transporter substrate-binding protein, partial [Nitrososphaeraceae archaeon]
MFNRIVSFLPSATEIIYLLESQDLLFGVTHQCVCPTEAKSKPRIISSSFDSESMTSFQIEEKIQELSRMQNDLFIINFDLLKKIQPDLIISQALCDVCSPHNKELDKTMKFLDNKPQTLVLDPHNVEEIIESIMIIARAVGKEEDGLRIKDSLYKRIEKISNATKFKKPKVICLEWIDPIYICGHWVPQMVGIVGAINGISKVGERSSKIDFSQITQFDPDIIILLPCGLDLSKVFQECSYLQTNKQWQSLRAVQNGMVFAVDALSYFSRPGPSIITG